MPSRADVVVIGGGYTGLSAARRLARNGASVVVAERLQVGAGASSRNAGQVLTGLRLGPETLVQRYGIPEARRLFAASLEAIEHLESLVAAESIDCEYERTGHLQAAWKPAHFDALRREQAALATVFNHRVELVPRREQRREVGSDRYHGVLVDERSAAINPERFVRGLAAAAARAGASIVCGVDVERLVRHDPARGWTVHTSRGSIDAREVVIATNGYTGPATPALRKRLLAIGSYIVVTEPLTESQAASVLPTRRMGFDTKNFLYYFRLTHDRRLLFGGRAIFSQRRSSVADSAAILRRGLIDVFPELRDVPLAYSWGGRVALARDQRPHAGRLADGSYFAAGYGGHGIAMATMLGDLVGRRIAGEPVDHPLVDDRCPSIPLYDGRPWFLPLVGAYYQVKDWIS